MATLVWIVIAAVVVLGLGLAAWRARGRRLDQKRSEAAELRRQAEAKTQRAEHRASVADEIAEGARAERREAEVAARRADEVDPDVDD